MPEASVYPPRGQSLAGKSAQGGRCMAESRNQKILESHTLTSLGSTSLRVSEACQGFYYPILESLLD